MEVYYYRTREAPQSLLITEEQFGMLLSHDVSPCWFIDYCYKSTPDGAQLICWDFNQNKRAWPYHSSLYRLPGCFRIDFKILVMTFRALRSLVLSHISDLSWSHESTCIMNSSGNGPLVVANARIETNGAENLPRSLQNCSPEDVKPTGRVTSFKSVF